MQPREQFLESTAAVLDDRHGARQSGNLPVQQCRGQRLIAHA
jgi:hypothetical protein